MNTDHDKRVKEIFGNALEKADAAERAAYVAQACGDDTQLRQQVEALLQAHEKAGGFLEEPVAALPGGTIVLSTTPSEKPGDRIGHYKLLAANRRRRLRRGLYGRTGAAHPPAGRAQSH